MYQLILVFEREESLPVACEKEVAFLPGTSEAPGVRGKGWVSAGWVEWLPWGCVGEVARWFGWGPLLPLCGPAGEGRVST